MTTNRRRKKDARALAAAEGIPYSQALERLSAGHQPAATGPRYVLQPTEAEAAEGIVAAELGVRALAPDATAEHRAVAEATWRPSDADTPCRCSGSCNHGKPCPEEYLDDDGREMRCTGHVIHVDRYPGSIWGVTVWEDMYACDDSQCDYQASCSVTLPEVPWGEQRPHVEGEGFTTVVYEGARHPMFGAWFGDDGEDEDYEYVDRGCPECGAGGPDDPYGECDCYDEDEVA